MTNTGTSCNNPGQTFSGGVCTSEDSDPIQPRLTLIKTVTNNNGGAAVATAWTLTATGPSNISGVTGTPAVTAASVNAGTYTLSETGGPAGYTAGTYSCVLNGGAAVVANSITLAAGDNATCTINNDDQAATLTLVKTVTNDNGGSAVATAWTLEAAGPTNITGATGSAAVTNASVNPGSYTLSETGGPAGYTAGTYSCVINGGAAVVNNTVALAAGDNATCTINNDDQAATLTLVKTVINDNRGTATTADFTLTATGPTSISGTSGAPAVTDAVVSSGTYTLTETNLAGYAAGAWSCTGGTLTGNSLVLSNGDDAECSITNDDIAGPEVSSSKSSDPATGTTVNPGATITYTLSTTVTTAALTSVYTLTDTISGDQTFGSVTNAGSYTCTGALSCTLPAGTLPGTYTLTYTTTVDADAAGTVGNSVTGTGGGDPDPECTNCTTTHPIAAPVISSSKSSDPATGTTVNPGATITYTLSTTISTAALTSVYTLTDTISGDQTFGSVTNAGSYTCTGTSPLSCTLPAGTLPGTYTLTYTTTVDADAAGTVGNSVTGTGGGDPDPECTNCTTTHPVAAPVISSSKSSDPATGTTVNPGATITYTLSTTVTTAALTSVYTLTDTISGDQTFGSVTNAGSYTCTGTGPLSCTLPAGTLPGTYTLTYTTTVDADAAGTVGNSVTGAGGGDPDPECTNCTTTHTVAAPVISSSKSSDPATGSTVNPGATITYTLSTTVTTAALTSVYTLTDTISGDQTFGSVTNAGSYTCTGTGPLSCTLPAGTLPGTYTLTYTTTVDADAAGTVGNSVTGTGGGDPDPECTNCTTTHPVAAPVISSSKSSDPATGTTVDPGATITYTLSTTISTAALTSVYTLTDTISGDQTFGSVTNAGSYTCTGTGPLSCTLPAGTLPGTYTLTYTTTVDADAAGTVGNSVTGTGGGDPDPECTNCTTTHPVAAPVISSSKSSDPATGTTVNPGATITYTLSTTISTAALTSVYTLTDTISGDQTFGSVTNAGSYICTGALSCTLPAGTLPGTYTLTYTTTVDADAAGTVGNSVTGTGGGDPDPECTNCTTTHPVAAPVIASSKSSDPATGTTVNPGATITYTLSTTVTTAALTSVYTLTDTISGDQTFGSVTNAGSYTCTGTGPLSCTLPAGTLPGTYTLTYTTTVDADAAGTVGNSVTGAGGGDPDPECTNCTTTHTVAAPVISSSKSSDPATGSTVNPGATITYTLSTTVTTAALTSVYTLTDTISGDQTFGSVTNAGSYTCTGTGPLSCTLPAGTLPGTYTLTYTTTVDADAAGTVGNSVTGTGGGDPDPECTNCATTHTVAAPVISSSKSSDPATGTTVNPGATITYTLSTTISTAALTSVYTLTDTISGDQTFGSVTNAGSYTCTGTGPLSCTLPAGTLPGTYTLTYTTTIDADAAGTVGNSVTGSGGGDPDPECTNCTTTHPIAAPVIASSKSSDPATGTTVNPGATITYTLSTTISTAALTSVYTLTDTISGDQTFGSVTNAGSYTCTGTGPLSCTLPAGTLPGTYTLTYTTTVDADAAGTVGNSVTGTGGGDPDPECTNCATTHTVAAPVIASSKSSDPATGTTVNPGATITYTLSTTIGTAALTAVYTLTDTISGDQTFGSVTNAGSYTCTGTGPLSCTLPAGTLPGTYTLTYTTTVDADAAGTVGNSVTGTGGGDPDPECTNCTTTHTVAAPVIVSSKSSDPATGTTVNPGATITYTLSTTISTAALTSVYTLTDTISGDQTFGSVTNAGSYTCTGALSCTLPAGTLPGTYTLTYTTTVDADAAGTVGNSVTGTGGGDPDPECTNCTTTHTVAAPVISSSKSSDPATGTTVNPGATITYTLSTTVTTAALTSVYTLTDTISGDQTFGSVTNAGSYTCTGTGPLSCTLPAGTLPGTYTLTYTTTVDADAAGTVGNSVTGSGGGDPDPECTNCATTHTVAAPVISSSKSSDPATGSTVNPGATITYTVTTTVGTAALTSVYTLTDTISGDQTFGSVTNAGSYTCTGTGPLSCTLPAGTLPGTYTLTYTTTVDADAAGTVGNSVTGTGGGDPDPECTNCTTTHTVAAPVIVSSKSSDPATGTTVNPGATITYTLSTTISTAALTSVYTLTDTISGDQTFGSVTNAGSYTCTGALSCTLPAGTLPGTYTLTYTTTVDADAAGTVGNSVTGTGGGDPDPECTNCTTTHTVAAPVISSSKSSDPATGTTVNPGATITYTLSTTISTAALTSVYTLTDTISGDQTFGSVTNAGSYTCTGTSPLSCTLPAGTLPGTYTLTYTTTVDADAAGTVGNSVTGTGGGDPDPECTNCTTTHPVAAPVISSSKSSDPATGTTVNPGATITYTLSTTVTTAALTSVYTLTDTISGDQTFGSVANAGSYTCTGTGPLSCTLPAGTLPGTYTLTYTTTVDADAAGTVGNSVTGTGGGDPDPECTNCTTTHPVAAPVISSSKSSDPATGTTVNPGATITYTLSTTISTAALTSVYTLTDTISGDQTFGSVTNAGSYTCTGTGPLSCTLPAGTLPGTYTLTYTTTVDADAAGTVGNSVTGTGGGDPDPECTNCTTTHPVAAPVISSSKSSDPATGTTVNPGATITYTLSTTVTTAALTSVYTLTDTISGDQTFGSVTNAGSYTCTGALSCTLPAGTLPGTYTLTYTTTVDADAAGTVGNSVTGTGGGDPDPECTNCTTTHPVAAPVISSSKSSDPATGTTVDPGATITYTLSTTISTAALTSIYTLTDTISGDQTFGSVTNAGSYTCTGALSCTLPAGTLPGTYTLTYTTTVDADAAGTVGNSVTGTGGGDPDPECTNCTMTHTVAAPVISSSKSSDPATGTTVNPGATITYTLSTTVTTAALTSVYTLTDTISGDQTFGSVTNAGSYTCTGTGPLSCTLPAGTLPGTYTLTYTTTVDADAAGTVGNSVTGSGGGDPDPECTNCTTTHTVAAPVIASSKSSDPATGTTVNPGATITYTLSTTVTTAALTSVYTLTDTISGDQTFGSVANAGSYTCTGTGPLSCTLPAGTLPGTYTLTYTTTVDADVAGTVGNSVTGTGGGDPDPECTNCTTTHPVAAPVISSSKSSDPATGTTVNPGATITYTLSTTISTAALTSVYTLTDTISGDQTFGSVTNAGSYTCTGTGPLSCTLPAGTLPGTYTLTYTTTVDADAAGTVGNSVTGTGGGDPDPECTNCTTTHPVAAPVISSSKSSDPATGTTVDPGATITYTLSTTISTAALTSIYTLTDTISGDQTFGSVTNAGSYTCTGALSCTLPAGTLPGTYTLTYTTTVDADAAGTVGNSVTGTGGGDPDPECTNCTTTHPVAAPVISSSKSSDPATGTTVNPGATITYTLSTTVTTAALTSVYTLTDTISGDQTFGSVTNAGSYTCTGALSCTLPAGTLPGTYTLTYTTTVDADAAGTVGNSVTGTGGGDPDPECANCTTTHPVAAPVISSSKSSDPATGTTVNPGATITYTLSTTVTTAALTSVYTLTDTISGDQTFGSVTNAGSYTCTGTGPLSCTLPAGTLPGTYTLTYTTTVDADAAGTVGNSVTGTGGGDPDPECTNCTTTHPVAAPVISSSKSSDPATGTTVDPGATITYTLSTTISTAALTSVYTLTDTISGDQTFGSVTNAGSYTCTGTGPLSCTLPAGTLPGAYTLTYTTTVDADAAGTVDNSVTGTGGGDPDPECTNCTTTHPVAAPVIASSKSSDPATGTTVNPGATITYTLSTTISTAALTSVYTLTDTISGDQTFGSVTNAGSYTCTGTGPLSCTLPAGTLPGTYTLTYTTTVDADAAGTVGNSVTGSGGGDPDPECTNCATTHTVAAPVISSSKSSDPATGSTVNPGATITYTLSTTVTTAALTSVYTLTDTISGDQTFAAITAPGAYTCTGTGPVVCTLPAGTAPGTYAVSYTTTINADASGTVGNSVVGNGGGDPDPECTSCTTTHPVLVNPALTITKTAGAPTTNLGANASVTDAGDTIGYTFVITNTGNVNLTNVVVNDAKLDAPAACNATTLAPNASTSCTGTHTITQEEVNAGTSDNTATATGTPPSGTPVTSSPASTQTPLPRNGELRSTKAMTANADEDGSGSVTVGDTLSYTITVTNIGNIDLGNVVVTDDKITPNTTTCAIVVPSATCVLTGTYRVTPADANAGTIRNAATVVDTPPPGGQPVCPVGSADPKCNPRVDVPVTQMPNLSSAKAMTANADEDGDGRVSVGDTLTYTVTATNTGNIDLTDVVVSDDKITPNSITCATVAPTGTCVLTGTYKLAQADADNGSVVNTATVSTSTPNVCPAGSTEARCHPTVTVPIEARPAVAIVKVATLTVDEGKQGVGNAGDVITYAVRITNTGNVTLNDMATSDVLENYPATTLSCGATSLAPGASTDCNAYTHTITREEANAGGTLDNMVKVTARYGNLGGGGTATGTATADATAIVPVEPEASSDLFVTKQANPRDVKIGDLVRYTLTIKNVGQVDTIDATLTDTPPAGFTLVEGSVQVADRDGGGRQVGSYPIKVDQIDIKAGESATVMYLLRVGAGVRPGTHVNRAYAEDGDVRSNEATAEVQLIADPLLDESLLLGTVFDDRDGDGWQDSADLSRVRVQGGFAADAYIANSTTVDRGDGAKPEPDASSPMLHGIDLGKISARQSEADPVADHRVVISQTLREPKFDDGFALTTAQGITVRMDAAGNTRTELSGDAAKNLTAAEPKVERHVAQTADGYRVDYIVSNHGIDERGIPGVRIASVEGLLIETDQFGRYHLEGVAGGPWERGRNFILKVDPATLPPGATFTTDNPLVRRLTPGIPVRFDFGVKLPPGEIPGTQEQVEMRIGEVMFSPGSAQVTPQYLPAIENMASKIKQYGGGEIVITANGENETLAMDRALAVRKSLETMVDPQLFKALQISVRTDPQDPATMVVGFAQWPLLGTVLFDTDKATIKPKYLPVIAKVAAALEQLRGTRVVITGHTDLRASDEYNVALGMRRTRAVFEAIVAHATPELRQHLRVDISNDPAAPADKPGK
ncbi:conserved repeat domain protein [Lysobacter capsici AZ78]|uniref:Conserved repeat domain protein n=1 Tax=Lysobacter capsici AZ78 TaxID=1444315 RepID=A0A108UBB5_9GAMM|nr:OmpA family protein [Lysobacter capsici]KWS05974.1 conserved repeat domain protein [Lysobacter capsici AZ78]